MTKKKSTADPLADHPARQNCPTCKGIGTVPHDHYTGITIHQLGTEPVCCRTCKGRGVVWEKVEVSNE